MLFLSLLQLKIHWRAYSKISCWKIPNGLKCLWCETIWPRVNATSFYCPPSAAARDAHEALLSENWWGWKNYQGFFDRKNSQQVGRSHSMKTQSSQSRTCTALWLRHWWPWGSQLSCPFINKGQITILKSFDLAMSGDIKRSNDAQLEMAIADSFHCENLENIVVESTNHKV